MVNISKLNGDYRPTYSAFKNGAVIIESVEAHIKRFM